MFMFRGFYIGVFIVVFWMGWNLFNGWFLFWVLFVGDIIVLMGS